jgi:hypothetical protein
MLQPLTADSLKILSAVSPPLPKRLSVSRTLANESNYLAAPALSSPLLSTPEKSQQSSKHSASKRSRHDTRSPRSSSKSAPKARPGRVFGTKKELHQALVEDVRTLLRPWHQTHKIGRDHYKAFMEEVRAAKGLRYVATPCKEFGPKVQVSQGSHLSPQLVRKAYDPAVAQSPPYAMPAAEILQVMVDEHMESKLL